MLLPFDSPTDDSINDHRSNTTNHQEKRQSISSALNLFIGDKILSLYGSTGTNVDTNNNQTAMINSNFNGNNSTSVQFDCEYLELINGTMR